MTPLLLLAAALAAAPTYAVTDRIAGPDGGWDLLAVDPAAHRLYVARSTGVMTVDLRTGAARPALAPALKGGHGVAVVPDSDRVVATSGGTDTAVIFDGATGETLATVPTGRKPDAVTFDPATRTAWVFDAGSGEATVIDPATAKVVATVPIGGSLELGAADGAGRLYLNVEDRNELVVIDTRARTVLARHKLAGCDGPTGIAWSAKARQVLSACANGVAKVTTADGRDVATLKIGPRPDGAAFDPARDVALVPTGGDGRLWTIRLGDRPQVLASTPTAVGARTIALDPSTGAAYLPSVRYGPAPATGGRPPAAPGSFAVLVAKPTP